MLDEICQYIDTNTALTLGTTLQQGFRPESAPDDCTMVTISARTQQYMPTSGVFWERTLRVITRGTSYPAAEAQAEAVHDILSGMANQTLPNVTSGEDWLVNTLQDISGPWYLGVDPQGRHEFTANYLARGEEI